MIFQVITVRLVKAQKSSAFSCLLMHFSSAMDRHMQHSVFHTIAFLEFSCLAISTLASWCRKFMSRIFHPCNMVRHFHVPQVHVSHFQRPRYITLQTLHKLKRHRIVFLTQFNNRLLTSCKPFWPHSPITCIFKLLWCCTPVYLLWTAGFEHRTHTHNIHLRLTK